MQNEMTQSLDYLDETPSQTAGPFVHIGCMPRSIGIDTVYPEDLGVTPLSDGVKSSRITVHGSVLDGTGSALCDAMLESWQPDAHGQFAGSTGADPKFSGFCRFACDSTSGEFVLHTVKPGRIKSRNGADQAPHISLWIVARGINIGLHTRLYFEDEDNTTDPLLSRIDQQPRIDTLIARKIDDGKYRFDIRLQGENETVFLDI